MGKTYGDQILDMVNRNVARKLSVAELNTSGSGTLHFTPPVVKRGSKPTLVRIVFNSSRSRDHWVKGPL